VSLLGRNLDDTLKAEAKIPPVKNTPSSDNDEWNWSWNTDADAIINKLGWAGLAKACAWYDPDGAEEKDENGYPKAKSAYAFPHHKLIDGELTLVWGGVRAAMQRCLALMNRSDVSTDVDLDGVYNHLSKHYKHFNKEVPEKSSKASFFDYDYESKLNVQLNKELDADDMEGIYLGALDMIFEDAKFALFREVPWGKKTITSEDIEDMTASLDVLDALKSKLKKLVEIMWTPFVEKANKKKGGNDKVELKDVKDFLNEENSISKEEAEILIKEIASKFGFDLAELDVEKALKDKIQTLEDKIDSLNQQIKDAQAEKEKIEADKKKIQKDFDEYKKQVEAEKEERRKDELAEKRMAELEEAGIKFSEERAKKVKARIREMSDEDFADYKEELQEIAAVKADKNKDEDKDLKKRMASLNLESKNNDEYSDYELLANEISI